MQRRVLGGIAVFLTTLFVYPAWAVDPPNRPGSPTEGAARDRQGGRLRPPGTAEEAEEATEDGLPGLQSESLAPRHRPGHRPGWRLGVYARNTPTGVVVTGVVPGSPAGRAGFEEGDRIVAVSGYQVGFVGNHVFYLGEELQRRADQRGKVLLLVQNVRNDRLLNLDVQLERRRTRPEPAIRFDDTGAEPARDREVRERPR